MRGSAMKRIITVCAIAVMLVAPGGLWGFVAQRFDIQIFPVRRRLTTRAD